MVISKFYNSNAMSKVLICSSYHWRWKFSLSFRDCSVFWEHQCHDFLKTRKLQLITDFMKFLKFNSFAIVRMIFQVTHMKFIFLKFGWPLFNLTHKEIQATQLITGESGLVNLGITFRIRGISFQTSLGAWLGSETQLHYKAPNYLLGGESMKQSDCVSETVPS